MSTPLASMAVLSVGALGVVFGDIGTSPLDALKEAFHSHSGHEVTVTPDNVVGLISLVFWAMTLVISVKYVRFVMRADNHGEGGILALTALIQPKDRTYTRTPVLDRPGMAKWREHLFVRMVRDADTADVYFNLPPEQTIEIGVQVEP